MNLELTIQSLLALGAATFLAGLVTTKVSIWLSHRLDILDKPDPRKAHREPIAYLGGLGMLLAFLAGVGFLTRLFPSLSIFHWTFMMQLLVGAVAIFLIGCWDDISPIPAVVKLGLQILVGLFMWVSSVRVELVSFLGDDNAQVSLLISMCITVGWYVVLMNSINLVDGLDGLAGGISLIGALSLVGVCLVVTPSNEVAIGAYIAIITAGAILAFLMFNWHPAKTFMGDGGSLLLGFLLATSSLVASTKTSTVLALSVPLVALGLPVFEIFFSFMRRAIKGQHPFKPDRRHLHHRLLDLGLNQRRVVLFLLYMTAFLGINSVILAKAESQILLFNVLFLLGGLVLLIENLKFLERERERHSKLQQEIESLKHQVTEE